MTECKCKNCVDKQPKTPKTHEVSITLWLNPSRRAAYINFYQNMLDNYDKTVNLVYSDIKERTEGYKKEVYDEFLQSRSPEDIDTFDIGSEAAYRLERDFLMHYQYHFSQLVNLYHTFEQQIRKQLYEELNHRLSPIRTKEVMKDFATKFGHIDVVLTELNYPYKSHPSWGLIIELNTIANTYKHGDGPAAQRLNQRFFVTAATYLFNYENERTKKEESAYLKTLDEEEKKEYREQKMNKLMDRELSTNLSMVLRADKTPFKVYVQAIIEFWKTFPEHLSSKVTVEVEPEENIEIINE
ncbi:hypothetical protein [Planococcus donghaensis]|uniref:hypothetical protein n=1 Tax=Planococcus donghaensis TaxID=414778 RepID=UPI003736A435